MGPSEHLNTRVEKNCQDVSVVNVQLAANYSNPEQNGNPNNEQHLQILWFRLEFCILFLA